MSTTGSPPERIPSGSSTSPRGYLFGNYTFRTPPRLNEFFTDFNTYAAGDWTVTASSGTSALIDANGGALQLTTSGVSGDVQGNQLVKKSFAFTSGSQVWFAINVKFATSGGNGGATAPAFMAGLANDFSALTPTDGVYFSKAINSTTMNCVIRAASTSTTITVGTVADNTEYTFGYYFDGAPTRTLAIYSTIGYAGVPTAFSQPYFSGGNQEVASASDYTGATNSLANLPTTTTLLTAGMAVKENATTFTGIAVVGYFLASEEIIGRF